MKLTITKIVDPVKGTTYRAEGMVVTPAGTSALCYGTAYSREAAIEGFRVSRGRYLSRQAVVEVEEVEIEV